LTDTVLAPTPSKQNIPSFLKAKILLDMRGCQCWFHVGPAPKSAGDQLFCAAATMQGETFCDEHRKLAYQPIRSRA
jgi:hypothetical protein